MPNIIDSLYIFLRFIYCNLSLLVGKKQIYELVTFIFFLSLTSWPMVVCHLLRYIRAKVAPAYLKIGRINKPHMLSQMCFSIWLIHTSMNLFIDYVKVFLMSSQCFYRSDNVNTNEFKKNQNNSCIVGVSLRSVDIQSLIWASAQHHCIIQT